MDYRRAYSWHINACKKRWSNKKKRTERHHVLPRCLGGVEVVKMSRMDHTYAHILLPFALLDEGKVDEVRQLGIPRPYVQGYYVLLSRRAMRLSKMSVWTADGIQTTMSLKNAAKLYCKRAHKNCTKQDNIGEMAFHLLRCAATGKPYFGKSITLVS